MYLLVVILVDRLVIAQPRGVLVMLILTDKFRQFNHILNTIGTQKNVF